MNILTICSLDVQCSSPVPIPSTAAQQSSYPSDMPIGTIPVSPGPMQRAFELDLTNMSPSPLSSPTLQSPLPTPMPGTNLTFEDIQPTHNIYSSDTYQSQESSGYFPPTNIGTVIKHTGATQGPIVASLHRCGQETLAKLSLNLDDQSEKAAGPAIHCRAESLAPGERESSAGELEYIESPLNVEHVVWEKPAPSSLISVNLSPRQSTWGEHNGLYDGTGYGDETRDSATSDSTRVDECVLTSLGIAEHHFDQNAEVNTESVQVENITSESAHSQAEHETLEEVISSYAVFERGSQAVSIDEELTENHSDANAHDKETESGA